MKRITILALLSGTMSIPAVAQDPHAQHTAPPTPATPAAVDSHSGHQTSSPADSAHSEHTAPSSDANHANHDGAGDTATGAALPVGDAQPPDVILDSAVEPLYGAGPMSRARNLLANEHGGALISKVMANILEYAEVDEGSGYRWDVEAWYGGDIHRFVFKTEGEAVGSDGAKLAETQALYSRAVGRYTDIQAGLRYDFEPNGRAYATVSVESLLPYWFEVEAAAFLSEGGDAYGRLEASHDLRFTQRLILQPRIELELAAQDVPDSGIGSGISSAELGLRLRYDIRRELAPYLGVNFEKAFGQTADFARAAGDDDEETSFVMGLRAWF